MTFSSSREENEKVFNNADSFAMAFDSAWMAYSKNNHKEVHDTEERLIEVLTTLKDHPFMVNSPSMAREVGKFRIRLLKLNS